MTMKRLTSATNPSANRLDHAPPAAATESRRDRDAHMRAGAVAGRGAKEGQDDRQQNRHRLGPGRGAVQHIARKDAPRDHAEISTSAAPATIAQSAVERVHAVHGRAPQRLDPLPASGARGEHAVKSPSPRAVRGEVQGPASAGGCGADQAHSGTDQFTAWMRLISSAYLAPYLSQTGFTASWNGCLVGDRVDLDAGGLHLGHRPRPRLSSHSWRHRPLRLARQLFDQRLVVLREAVPAARENTRISGTIRCSVRV